MRRNKPFKSAWPTQDREGPLTPAQDWALGIALTVGVIALIWGVIWLFGGK